VTSTRHQVWRKSCVLSYAGPQVWNALLENIRHETSSVNSRHSRFAEPSTVNCGAFLAKLFHFIFHIFICGSFYFSGFSFQPWTFVVCVRSCARSNNDYWWWWWWLSTVGKLAFLVAASRIRKSLPLHVTSAPSLYRLSRSRGWSRFCSAAVARQICCSL